MEREKELFICPRPGCTQVLLSLPKLEDHIQAEHSKEARSSTHIEQLFSFEQEPGEKQRDIQEEEEEFEFEPKYQESELVKDQVEKKDDVPTVVPVEKLNVLIDLMKVKKRTKEKPEIKYKERAKKLKKLQKNNVFLEIKSKPKPLMRKSKSSFTMEDIESKLGNLEEKARAEFQLFIDEGRDEEIYTKIFGDFDTNREWICIYHEDGKFQGNRRAFALHFKEEHRAGKLYTCELCQKSKKNFSVFLKHLRETHFKDIHCDACNLTCSNSRKLQTHLFKIHGKGGVSCDLCQKKLASKENLKIHKTLHSSDMFPCSVCPRIFKSKYRVVQHEKIHSLLPTVKKERRIIMKACKDCGRTFRSDKFSIHRKFHEKDKSLQCQKCEKFFHSPTALKHHVKTVHERIREFSCKDCLFSSSTRTHLQHHIDKVHHNVLDTCHICQVKIGSEYHHVVGYHKKETSWKEYVENKMRIKSEASCS